MSQLRRNAAKELTSFRYRSPNVPLKAIREFANCIVEKFHPETVILFGSYANGQPHADSNVDLLVVMPAANEIDQAVRIQLALEPMFPLDLIVRTPKKLSRSLAEGDWFLREVLETGKVLHGIATSIPTSPARQL